jgi:hypothetical protein
MYSHLMREDMLIVPPGKKIRLRKDYDPGGTGGLVQKKKLRSYLPKGFNCWQATRASSWYVVPADHTRFARIAVAAVIGKTLKGLKLPIPTWAKRTGRIC